MRIFKGHLERRKEGWTVRGGERGNVISPLSARAAVPAVGPRTSVAIHGGIFVSKSLLP